MPVGQPEFVDNPEPRCPVVLLIDTSGSMENEPIDNVNKGISIFREELIKDEIAALRCEVCIVTFGGDVKVIQHFVTVDEFEPSTLYAGGGTPMGEAIEQALSLIEERKNKYKENGIQYYRPWIMLITDGAPTDGDLWKASARELHDAYQTGKCLFYAIAVKGADMDTLSEIAPREVPPQMLEGMKFRELFVWLSASMKKVSSARPGEAGHQETLPPINGWAMAPTSSLD